jgi:hypothetical protein
MRSRRIAAGLGAAVAVLCVALSSVTAIADEDVTVEEETVDSGTVDDLIITEPIFAPPTVVSPQPGEEPRIVQGPEDEWFWVLEVTNSDYQPAFVVDDGYVGFETLPSIGIFDTVSERLAWTNQTFACFVGTTCEEPKRTADQVAFGDDFIKLPKLFEPTTGRVAYDEEHAYFAGQELYQWIVGQETLSLAIPLAQTPTGVIEVWVGYTFVYTDDLVGVPVRFTEEAMAITYTTVDVPPVPGEEPDGGVPLWVVQAVLGIVGILAFFGIIAMIVSRMVAITRNNT